MMYSTNLDAVMMYTIKTNLDAADIFTTLRQDTDEIIHPTWVKTVRDGEGEFDHDLMTCELQAHGQPIDIVFLDRNGQEIGDSIAKPERTIILPVPEPVAVAVPEPLKVIRIVRFPDWELRQINPWSSNDGFRSTTSAYGLTLRTDTWSDTLSIEGGEISPDDVDEIHIGDEVYLWHSVYESWTTEREED